VSPIVGLKHPPESDPTIPINANNVKTTVIVPKNPSLVEANFLYFVWQITPTNKMVKIASITNTCHSGNPFSPGFKIKVSYFYYKPQAIAIPVYAPKISANITVIAIGKFLFQ